MTILFVELNYNTQNVASIYYSQWYNFMEKFELRLAILRVKRRAMSLNNT